MAKEEINFIRPQEFFTPATNKAKVRYRGYNGREHDVQLAENLDGDVEEIVNDTFVPNNDGNVVFTDENNVAHSLITEQGLGKAQMIKTTWQALKNLRVNSQLVAGSLYRITDYQCTTTQENTQSAGHQFDIVLLALSENKLAEEGWAMMNESNIYDVTFVNDNITKKCWLYDPQGNEEYNIVACDTLLGLSGLIEGEGEDFTFNEDGSISFYGFSITELTMPNLTYNYFQHSNLSAWKVWYCLDNDKSRFAWADDSVDEDVPAKIQTNGGRSYTFPTGATFIRDEQDDEIDETSGKTLYAWVKDDDNSTIVYTISNPPRVGRDDYLYIKGSRGFEQANGNVVDGYTPPTQGTGLPNGRGVIYRLIDEWNNDVAYDFKNIQYKTKLKDGMYLVNGTDEWVYTFNAGTDDNEGLQDASMMNGIYDTLADNEHGCYNNKITNHLTGFSDTLYILPKIICALYYLNGDSTIDCTDNNFLHCSNTICSGVLTSCDFKFTTNLKIENAFVCTFINCSGTFNSNVTTPNIYIQNKKVLTEE